MYRNTVADNYRILNLNVISAAVNIQKLIDEEFVSLGLKAPSGNIVQVNITCDTDCTLTDGFTMQIKTLLADIEYLFPIQNWAEKVLISTSTTANIVVEVFYNE